MVDSLQFNGCTIMFDKAKSLGEFNSFIDRLPLQPPFIVKPNWICEEYAHQTDPVVLTWLLENLTSKGETYVVEAYSARNHPPGGPQPPSEDKLEWLRRSDEGFLRRQGLDVVFHDLGITYLNIDEEILAGRAVDPGEIQSITESSYPPVERKELYSFVPEKLYQMRNGTLIDFAKFKLTFSMCTKNLFGLIPDCKTPGGRGAYHGKKDRQLPRNIVDINKIYRAVFNVIGLVEGVRSLTGFINRGPYHSMFGYDYEVHEDLGLVYYGSDPLWLDAFICAQCGIEPKSYRTSVLPEPHLALGYEEISPWPQEIIEAAKNLGSPI